VAAGPGSGVTQRGSTGGWMAWDGGNELSGGGSGGGRGGGGGGGGGGWGEGGLCWGGGGGGGRGVGGGGGRSRRARAVGGHTGEGADEGRGVNVHAVRVSAQDRTLAECGGVRKSPRPLIRGPAAAELWRGKKGSA